MVWTPDNGCLFCMSICRCTVLTAAATIGIYIGVQLDGKSYVAGDWCRIVYYQLDDLTDYDIEIIGESGDDGQAILEGSVSFGLSSQEEESEEACDDCPIKNCLECPEWVYDVQISGLPESYQCEDDELKVGDEGMWGVTIIAPVIQWFILKGVATWRQITLLSMKLSEEQRHEIELAGQYRHLPAVKFVNYCMLNAANVALIPLLSIADSTQSPEIMAMHLAPANNVLSVIGFLTIIGLMGVEGIHRLDRCVKEDPGVWLTLSPQCLLIPHLMVWILFLQINFSLILFVSFDFQLNWPMFALQGQLCTFKIFVFMLWLFDQIGTAMDFYVQKSTD